MLRVALIGCGGMGNNHARAIAEISGMELACAAEADQARRERFGHEYGVPTFEHWTGPLQQDGINLAIIALPHHLHAPVAVEAFEAGLHVLCEKPMAITSDECDSMNEAAIRAGKKLMVGMTWHFNPATVALHEIVTSGRIGDPLFGEDTIAKSWGHAKRQAWQKSRKHGGGMWMTNGIHQVDRLSWLMCDQITTVDAKTGTFQHSQEADDMTMATVRFLGGAFATITCFGFAKGGDRHSITIWGSNGAARYNDGRIDIGVDGAWETIAFDTWLPLHRQLEALQQSIEGNTDVPVDGQWGKYTVRAVLAGEKSSNLQRPVSVLDV